VSDEDPEKNPILLEKSVLQKDNYYALYNVSEKRRGDASVHYLYHHEHTIPKIKEELGDIPIIILLRNPVERAISNAKYLTRHFNYSIKEEIELSEIREQKNFNSFWYHRQLGLYASQVEAYLNNFKDVKVIIFEDFIKNTEKELNEVCSFLGVKQRIFQNTHDIHNASRKESRTYRFFKKSGILKLFKFGTTDLLRKRLKKLFKYFFYTEYENLTVTEKKKLSSFYESDIKRLENILRRKLWKN
jgi:hypothetical protein